MMLWGLLKAFVGNFVDIMNSKVMAFIYVSYREKQADIRKRITFETYLKVLLLLYECCVFNHILVWSSAWTSPPCLPAGVLINSKHFSFAVNLLLFKNLSGSVWLLMWNICAGSADSSITRLKNGKEEAKFSLLKEKPGEGEGWV